MRVLERTSSGLSRFPSRRFPHRSGGNPPRGSQVFQRCLPVPLPQWYIRGDRVRITELEGELSMRDLIEDLKPLAEREDPNVVAGEMLDEAPSFMADIHKAVQSLDAAFDRALKDLKGLRKAGAGGTVEARLLKKPARELRDLDAIVHGAAKALAKYGF